MLGTLTHGTLHPDSKPIQMHCDEALTVCATEKARGGGLGGSHGLTHGQDKARAKQQTCAHKKRMGERQIESLT